MRERIIEFEYVSNNNVDYTATAEFELEMDYEETRYGERIIYYWQLRDLQITPPPGTDYKELQDEAFRLAERTA